MDISKLPRMSETSKHAPPPPPAGEANDAAAHPARFEPPARDDYSPAGFGAEAWISIAVGVILILMAPRIWQYLFSQLFGTAFTWTFTDEQNNPLPYTKSIFFWGDLAMALFAVVLIVDGLVLGFARRRAMIGLALGLTLVATMFNLGYVVWIMSQGYAFQIMSALAVAFGVYIAIQQKRLLAMVR